MLRIKTALRYARRFLSNLDQPALEAEILLCYALERDRFFIKTNPAHKINDLNTLKFLYVLVQRRFHIPVAYITGHKAWSDFDLKVNKHVLIPRDETEILCHHILDTQPSPTSILDIGTGSGCISLFMAKHFPASKITAFDISHKALKTAQKNANTYNFSNIKFQYSDLLKTCPQESHYDLIIANLPYVPEKLPISSEVSKEPSLALFSGSDGLNHIRRLKDQLTSKKIAFQQLWLEFLPQQESSINYLENKIFFALIYSSSHTLPQRSPQKPQQESQKSSLK